MYASIKPGHRAKSADLKKLQVWSWQIWKSLDSNQFRQISLVLRGWHWCLEGLRAFDHLRDWDCRRNSATQIVYPHIFLPLVCNNKTKENLACQSNYHVLDFHRLLLFVAVLYLVSRFPTFRCLFQNSFPANNKIIQFYTYFVGNCHSISYK